MKIALVFVALLGMVVVGLPFSIAGDSSLTGAVQSFLAYGLTATSVLLSLLTIFLSRSLSSDLVNRHVFFVMTKPIPRWEYLLGKWLGITLLNGAFVVFSGVAIYGMTYYIRWSHPPIDEFFDKEELVNEVLVARHALKTKLPDFEKSAERDFQQNLEEGVYHNAPNFDPATERARLAMKRESQWRVVGPMETRLFEFENVLCDRDPKNSIHIRYKTEVTGYAQDEVFRAVWRFGEPRKGTTHYDIPVRHVVGRRHSIQVPANVVAEDRTLRVELFNENPFPGEPQYRNVLELRKSDEVEVLFAVGSFEGNLFRLLILMMCKLMFLASVAVLAAAAVTFPVACFASFIIYLLAGARSFFREALEFSSGGSTTWFSSVKDFLVHSITYAFEALCWIIPDFPKYDGVETLVSGHNVGLVWVIQGISDLVLLKTVIVLGLAMLLFQRREVAEVSL
ncbi:MAG: ABC transporter permease [Planctomycetota bacterium]